MIKGVRLFTILFGLSILAGPAAAEWDWGKGSFSDEVGFTRYIPPLSNPLFNETPYITTEVSIWY